MNRLFWYAHGDEVLRPGRTIEAAAGQLGGDRAGDIQERIPISSQDATIFPSTRAGIRPELLRSGEISPASGKIAPAPTKVDRVGL